jgi:hypothetical protein
MNAQMLQKAIELAEERQHLLISTANGAGMPHIASVGSIRPVSQQKLALGDWYCPATVFNIQENSQVSMIVWEIATDTGYQLLGEVEAIRPTEDPTGDPFERELIVHIDNVLTFSHAYHTDVEMPVTPEELHPPLEEGHEQPTLDKKKFGGKESWRESYLFLK